MNFQVGVVAVGFTRQQRLDTAPLRLLGNLAQLRSAFGDAGIIALGLAQLDQRHAIFKIALQRLVSCHRALQLLALAHDFLCAPGIIPQAGILSLLVEFRQPSFSSIPVKDASLRGPRPP